MTMALHEVQAAPESNGHEAPPPDHVSESDFQMLADLQARQESVQAQLAEAQAAMLRHQGAVAFVQDYLTRTYDLQTNDLILADRSIKRAPQPAEEA